MEIAIIFQSTNTDKEQAALVVLEYIEAWYNRKRPHAALGYRSPDEYGKTLNKQKIAAYLNVHFIVAIPGKQSHSFPGNGKVSLTAAEQEVAQLKKELRETQMERDILKKAVSIFSRSDGKYSGS